jgi:hypothetical protein
MFLQPLVQGEHKIWQITFRWPPCDFVLISDSAATTLLAQTQEHLPVADTTNLWKHAGTGTAFLFLSIPSGFPQTLGIIASTWPFSL